ncbi:hypothetical protein M9H77_08624 [Catharanthus roseus]|uniref:Uncharacterized protein n=1 Tax=Catharanthus roseus TaxID=4058 RepID=A0ACC0BYB0_CATRO|nr:hypothetical protein M9H77_08624 [Catharanthus roseus]
MGPLCQEHPFRRAYQRSYELTNTLPTLRGFGNQKSKGSCPPIGSLDVHRRIIILIIRKGACAHIILNSCSSVSQAIIKFDEIAELNKRHIKGLQYRR